MATQIQFRRGTATQHNSFTGATAEVTVNTTNKSVHVHDGTTQGGFELARADLSNTSGLSLSGLTTTTNLKVSNDLYVSGVSTFVGAVTFQGGTITLGDANTDNVVFTADVNSNIVPNTDNSYDLGSSSQQWRNLYVNGTSDLTDVYVSGIGTVSTLNSTSGTITSLNVSTGNIITGVITNISGSNLNYSGIGTIATLNSILGTITNLSGTNLNYSGIATVTTLNVGSNVKANGGILTATTFSGNLEKTLTLNTSGTGLSGSSSFNNSGDATFTVISNATSSNTNSTIVARDTNGGFSAGIVTATTFSGNLANTLTMQTSGTGLSGSTTFNNSGASVFTVNSNATNADTASTLVARDSSGNFIAGVITATTFSGAFQGNASTATALQNARTISLTGDVSGVVSFDGTSNVSIAATIQPDSVGLGTDTTGPYVQSISGTASQITVTGGTGEGSTPTLSITNNPTLPGNVTIANDLQVNNNLNVTGNITIGGTTAFITVNDFRVKDADIVLGFTTNTSNQEVSSDTTANHGGIAIASTEGSPLIQLVNVAIGETLPATYKKLMWFRSGAFAGLGTDAWLSNYAIGIGSTQVPNGARLAVGRVIVNDDDISDVRNINASGIVTAPTLNSTTGTITTLNSTGVTAASVSSTWSQVGSGLTFTTGIATNFTVSGVATVTQLIATNVNITGVATFAQSNPTNLNVSGVGTITTLKSTWSQVGSGLTFFSGIGTNLNISGISTLGVATCTSLFSSGIITATDFNSTSDINLKENIRPIQNSTEIVSGLEGVRFVWKADGKESIGVIAQEIEKTLPELVSNGDIKTVNYNGLIGVLIEAVKDQQNQINALKIEIENLKK